MADVNSLCGLAFDCPYYDRQAGLQLSSPCWRGSVRRLADVLLYKSKRKKHYAQCEAIWL